MPTLPALSLATLLLLASGVTESHTQPAGPSSASSSVATTGAVEDVPIPVARKATGSKFAWVTIYYEVGKNDAEYHLGARVLMRSIKESGTEADRVVLIAEGTQQKYADKFIEDGLKLEWVRNIDSPWSKTLRRFAFALNKLKIWAMTEYDRVIFLDADVIVLQPADFMFNCGHFCAVFFNPINFHTAILVVKPDKAIYDDMVKKINDGMASFDGADQGFINSYFTGLNAAKEWTKALPPSEDKMNRLPVNYNMHHIYYYEKMSWGGPWGRGEDIVTMTYPIAQFGKPWVWYGYPMMDMHFLWLKYRNQIDVASDYPVQICVLLMAPLLHLVLSQVNVFFFDPSPPPIPSPFASLWTVSALKVTSSFSVSTKVPASLHSAMCLILSPRPARGSLLPGVF